MPEVTISTHFAVLFKEQTAKYPSSLFPDTFTVTQRAKKANKLCNLYSSDLSLNYLSEKRMPENFDSLFLSLPLSFCSKGILCCSYHVKT